MTVSDNLRRLRVLVVEADAIIGLDLSDALDEAGYEVIGPHATCAEALAWLDVEMPHAAILDLTLENGKCADVGRFLKEKQIPLVAFSIRSEIRFGRG
jgi:DNA-binding response OmpR family regulator